MTSRHTPAAAADNPPAPEVDARALFDGIVTETAHLFTVMGWAEHEIAEARRRHPRHADAIWHAFGILTPRDIGPGMTTEFVYRGHARELLDRIAGGVDLRPATAAEILLTLVEASLRAPMHGPAAGLYFRMWQTAFPAHPITVELGIHQIHYEHLHGPRIDELEADLRHRLRDPDRQAGDVSCGGRHHGEPVTCTFTAR
jgi:hypothetical protein